jgi:hypothetical protein
MTPSGENIRQGQRVEPAEESVSGAEHMPNPISQ